MFCKILTLDKLHTYENHNNSNKQQEKKLSNYNQQIAFATVMNIFLRM